ncbi:sigma-70 family RNA polymerase sigma factor [Thermaerobacillus caldiproteolyticus]|uniref:sigma-70 family RNA polymerase sigma factor n=1 Tax=Thermaerobacillus caldiproteolyticus TaxID=247480 RepID=UPI00188C42BD|nr:sigma-70 family RNA polymerase sigma factor [Anoxybacillus caldiproteolyticus]QPA31255.1 sigma-70 family RNA polymerase sigma factor [Anoxybacillus caldiproteolyticus]
MEAIQNPLSDSFVKSEEGNELVRAYLSRPSKENLDRINEAFKSYCLKIKTFSYFSKTMGFEAKHFDKKRRKIADRFLLILDAPIDGEESITMKDVIADPTQNTLDIPLETWEDNITNEDIRNAIKDLTERQKEVIKYSFFQDMKDREITNKLGISQQAVSKTRKAALDKLRRELSNG